MPLGLSDAVRITDAAAYDIDQKAVVKKMEPQLLLKAILETHVDCVSEATKKPETQRGEKITIFITEEQRIVVISIFTDDDTPAIAVMTPDQAAQYMRGDVEQLLKKGKWELWKRINGENDEPSPY